MSSTTLTYAGILVMASAGQSRSADDDVRVLLAGEEGSRNGEKIVIYKPFGGKVKEGESGEIAAIREFREESMGCIMPPGSGSGNGLVDDLKVITDNGITYIYMMSEYSPDIPIIFESLVYAARRHGLVEAARKVKDGSFEISHLRWVSMATLKEAVSRMLKKSIPVDSEGIKIDVGIGPLILDRNFVNVLKVLFDAFDYRR